VRSNTFQDQKLVVKELVVLDPNFLVHLFRSVVTVRHAFANNGVMKLGEFKALMKRELGLNEQKQIDEVLDCLQYFDVVHKLDSDHLLVPCSLPENNPVRFSSDGWECVRKSFLIKVGNAVPETLVAKVFVGMIKIGKNLVQAWRTGCIAAPSEDETIIVRRDTIEIRYPPSSKYTLAHDVLHLAIYYHGDKSAALNVFRRIEHHVQNVLSDLYHIPYRLIIPIDDQCSDFCDSAAVTAALTNQHKEVITNNQQKVRIDIICPDINLQDVVPSIPINELQIIEEIGKGAYGEVSVAIWNQPNGGQEYVAVKKTTEESKLIIFKARREAYLMSCVKHPNIVSLR
jgi:hypothetical protein